MHAPLPTGTTTPEPGSPLEPRKHNIIGKPFRNGNHSPLACTKANTDERPTKLRTYDIVVRDTPDPRRKIGILSMKPDTPSHIMINVKPLHAIITSHVGLVTVARSLATRKPTPRWHRNTNNLPTIWYEFDGMRSHPPSICVINKLNIVYDHRLHLYWLEVFLGNNSMLYNICLCHVGLIFLDIFVFCFVCRQWHHTSNYFSSVNIIAVDDLSTQGTRA